MESNIDNEILEKLQEAEAAKPQRKPKIGLICAFLIAASSVLPLLILYSNNTGIRFMEVLLPTAIILAVACVLFFLLWLILKKPLLAALCTFVTILLAMNFHLFRKGSYLLFSGRLAAWVAFIAWLIVLAALIFVIFRLKDKPFLPQIAQILCIALAALIVFNAVQIVPAMIKQAKLNNYESQSPAEPPVMTTEAEFKTHTVEANGRNFYWIMFDEFADDYTMETYFGQTEASFTEFLESKGFSVSKSSASNSNNSTLCAIDAASLSYFSSDSAIRRAAGVRNPTKDGAMLRRTGELYTALHDLDYQIYQVSSHPSHYTVVDNLLPQTLMEQIMVSTTVEGLSVLDLAKQMSVLSAFSAMFPPKTADESSVSAQLFNASFRARVMSVFNYYNEPENLCFANKTALFTYILCPHTPFVFDENGDSVPSSHRRDWTKPVYYANQHKYMEIKAEEMVENILAVDPDAVILLQSDHGVRGGYFVNKGMEIAYADQLRIYNALYFGGEQVDIEGLSAVNTLRYVLNLLGGDYPLLNDAEAQPYYYEKQVKRMEMIEQGLDPDAPKPSTTTKREGCN